MRRWLLRCRRPTPKRPTSRSTDVANLPAAGVRARGISEKAIFEKPAAVKPAEKPQEKSAEKSIEKPVEKSSEPSEGKPAETASIPVETRPHTAAPREKEKTAIRTIPLTAPAVQSAVAAPNPASAVEAAVTPEDHRDANDLARAAIERLRGSSPRTQETARVPESPRNVAAPQTPAVAVSAPAIRPLPPPIMVSTPPADSYGPAMGPSPGQPYSNSARSDDPRRPTPPADIPLARPLDLNAGNAGPAEAPAQEHTNVAQDMLLAAKSMFHSVLPQ